MENSLRQLRHTLGFSQIRLARVASVPVRRIQLWEQNLYELSADEELRVLRVLRRAALGLQSFLAAAFGDRVQRRRPRRRQVGKT
jgi:DNA-binding transcriptional regulator YiaG